MSRTEATPHAANRHGEEATEADLQFLEYQRTGSPRCLARVFDLLAGELLMLAEHLSHDASAAEDLVQTTFLHAIESAERFELTSGIKPWLSAILTNHARMEWRRIRRRVDPGKIRGEQLRHPDFEAEAAEFRAALRHALEGMPPRYREVIRLGLLHGLSLREVGHAIGERRETVKSRWRRGMEMLRGALPNTLALGAIITMTPGRGLAAVREVVLERADARAASLAGDGAGAGGGAGLSGGLLLLGAAVFALVGVLLTYYFGGAGAGAVADSASVPGDVHARSHDAAAPTETDRTAIDRPAEESTATTGDLAIEVRFADGRPGRGVTVAVRPSIDESRSLSWLRERRVACGADGVARFPALPVGEVLVRGDRGGLIRVVVSADQTLRTELKLPAGEMLSGLALDKNGEPLFGARVMLLAPGRTTDEALPIGVADVDGRFSIRDVQEGWSVTAAADGHLGPRWYGLPAERMKRPVRLQFRGPSATLRGVVRDPMGLVLPGAAVFAGLAFDPNLDSDDALGYARRTDQYGRFAILDVDPRSELPLWVRAPGTAVWRRSVKWLGAGRECIVDVQLQAGARVVGEVTHDGESVSGARVEARQTRVENGPLYLFAGPAWARVTGRSDAAGRFELTGVHPGEALLTASDRVGLGTMRRVHLKDEEATRWHARLGAGTAIRGRVLDPRGKPLVGWSVRLVAERAESIDRRRFTRSDATGRFVFDHCRDVDYVLRFAAERRSGRQLLKDVHNVRPGPDEIECRMPNIAVPSCFVSGTAIGADGTPLSRLRVFSMRRLGDQWIPTPTVFENLVAGRFRVGPILPGEYSFLIQGGYTGMLPVARETLVSGQHLAVGQQSFAKSGYVRVRVKDPDGTPTAALGLYLWSRDDQRATTIRLAGGVGVSRALQPGVHCAGVWPPGALPVYREFKVEPGAVRDADFVPVFGGQPVCFRLRSKPGPLQMTLTVARGEEIVFRERRPVLIGSGPLDDVRHLAAGDYTVTLFGESGRRVKRSLRVTVGETRPVVDLDLREAR